MSINQLLLLLTKEKAVLSPIQTGLLNFIDWLQFSCYFFLTTKTTTTTKKHKTKQRQQIMIFHQANDQFKGKSLENGII